MDGERLDFRNLTYSQGIQIVSPYVVHQERKRYNRDKLNLKRIVYQYYYHSDYFKNIPLSLSDRRLLMSGFSPIDIDENNHEFFRYSIHHIIPLNCGGTTESKNLIPLPRRFHDFVHSCIIDPQIYNMKVGETTTLQGLPDFFKITLEQMQDETFIRDYHKFIIDYCEVMPIQFRKIKKKERKDKFNSWYRKRFREERQ